VLLFDPDPKDKKLADNPMLTNAVRNCHGKGNRNMETLNLQRQEAPLRRLMGYSSSADNVLFFIPAISRALALQGYKTDLAAGLDAVLSELDGNGNNGVKVREKAAA
jgi:hypothetical protein